MSTALYGGGEHSLSGLRANPGRSLRGDIASDLHTLIHCQITRVLPPKICHPREVESDHTYRKYHERSVSRVVVYPTREEGSQTAGRKGLLRTGCTSLWAGDERSMCCYIRSDLWISAVLPTPMSPTSKTDSLFPIFLGGGVGIPGRLAGPSPVPFLIPSSSTEHSAPIRPVDLHVEEQSQNL